jgi:hypothetical protein
LNECVRSTTPVNPLGCAAPGRCWANSSSASARAYPITTDLIFIVSLTKTRPKILDSLGRANPQTSDRRNFLEWGKYKEIVPRQVTITQGTDGHDQRIPRNSHTAGHRIKFVIPTGAKRGDLNGLFRFLASPRYQRGIPSEFWGQNASETVGRRPPPVPRPLPY